MNNNRGFHLSVSECPQSDLLTIPSWTSSCKNDLVIFWQFIHSINIAENPTIQRWLEESCHCEIKHLSRLFLLPCDLIVCVCVCVSELVCCIGGIKWCSITIQTLNSYLAIISHQDFFNNTLACLYQSKPDLAQCVRKPCSITMVLPVIIANLTLEMQNRGFCSGNFFSQDLCCFLAAIASV